MLLNVSHGFCGSFGTQFSRLQRLTLSGSAHVRCVTSLTPLVRTAQRTSTNRLCMSGRGFGTTNNTPTNEEALKAQKLKDLIASYKKNGQAGPIDVHKLDHVLQGTAAIENTAPIGSRRVFDETMKFPTEFMIKIVGQNEPTFVTDMLKIVAECLNQEVKQDLKYSIKETAGGKYVSVSVKPLFHSADELYATYEALGKDTRVKFTL